MGHKTRTISNFQEIWVMSLQGPEYLLDGKLTNKSDGYAYGVVLLELLLGKKNGRKIVTNSVPINCHMGMLKLKIPSKLNAATAH